MDVKRSSSQVTTRAVDDILNKACYANVAAARETFELNPRQWRNRANFSRDQLRPVSVAPKEPATNAGFIRNSSERVDVRTGIIRLTEQVLWRRIPDSS